MREQEGPLTNDPNRRRRVLTAAAALLLLLALSLAACNDDGDGDGGMPSASASPTDGPAPSESADPTLPAAITEIGIELDEFVIRPDQTRARPGVVLFKVDNTGESPHQFLVIRSELPTAQLPRAAGGLGADEGQLEVAGRIERLLPGESGELRVDVEFGKYVLICNLIAGDDSHYLNGMYNAFSVQNDAPIRTPTP